MRWVFTVLLVGCAPAWAPATVLPVEEHYPPTPVTYNASVDDSPAVLTKREPCPECDERRALLKGAEDDLASEAARREEYVIGHCKGIVTHTTHVLLSGPRVSSGPERAWLCDGKLVEVPETREEQALAMRIGNLHSWIRKNCEDEILPAVGEKRCRP